MMTQQKRLQFFHLAKEDLLPLLATHLKGLLHFEHINFKNMPDNGHDNEPI
jgi:hypothetical protein